MDGRGTATRRDGALAADEGPANDAQKPTLALRAIEFSSGQHLLKDCEEDLAWKNGGSLCPAPDWTPERQSPISHTMGESVRVAMTLGIPDGTALEQVDLRGEGPGALRFAEDDVTLDGASARVGLVSIRPLPKRIAKVSFGIRWSASDGEVLSPEQSDTVAYVTMDRPRDDQQASFQEDGVTVKRMDRAVSWVEPLHTLRPHSIVRALMGKFPYYSLRPSPKVPRKYHHPTYFNEEGGAWPMSDYVEESGECQAIVRLVRGVLRQLGVPGEARALLVWADPDVEGGKKAISAYWDEDPYAGLGRTKMVKGKRWLAALVDAEVEVGKEYPASHTIQPDGNASPGLNRYEACLEFTHEGVTRDYGGGAGIFRTKEAVLRAFWGLIWVSATHDEGFEVEEIVARY